MSPSPKSLVLSALDFRSPARLPLCFRTDRERSDFLILAPSPAPGKPIPPTDFDEWGCQYEAVSHTGARQCIGHPLADDSAFDAFIPPDPDSPGRFDEAIDLMRRYPDRFALGNQLGGFTRMFFLRGFEQLLIDFHTDEALVERLADIVFSFDMAIAQCFADLGADAFSLFEDWGTQEALIISPALWRRFFKPRYRALADLLHSRNLRFMMHSCGQVWDIIPDLIEIGLDILNVEQLLIFSLPETPSTPAINGIDRLAQTFGGKITIMTNVDSQRTLINGTLEEIRAEARHIVKAFRPFHGGLIPLADCTRDHGYVPDDRIEAMAQAFEER